MYKILDGKKVSRVILSDIKKKISIAKKKRSPKIAFILVGDDEPSKIYVRNKQKACESTSIDSEILHLEHATTTEYLISKIQELNTDSSTDGFIVQLPLPSHIDKNKVLDSIEPMKDVDGITTHNQGKLFQHNQPYFIPCTPLGIITLLKHYDIALTGKHVVIIGRSTIVGKPLAALSLKEDATVTILHSKTKDIPEQCKTADIIIVAIGKANFLKGDWIKQDTVIVDVGITRHEGKLIGDVNFNSVARNCSYITPVPNGVGPMTIAMLLSNTYNAWLSNCE